MKKREIFFVCIAAFVLSIIVILPSVGSIYGVSINHVSEVSLYNEGWYYSSGGEKIFCQTSGAGDVPKENRTVIYLDVTPENAGKWLLMMLSGYGVKCYADGSLIYEGEYVASPKYGRVPFSGNHYIRIPEDAGWIALEFTCPYKSWNNRLPTIYLGDTEADLLYLNHTVYQFHQFMDLLFMMSGVMMLLLALYRLSRHEKSRADFYLGLLLVAVGLWLRVGTFDVEIRRVPREVLHHASYCLWYVIPVLLCGFLSFYLSESRKKYRMMQLICLAGAALIQTLWILGIAEYAESVFITHIELAVLSVILSGDVLRSEIGQWRAKQVHQFHFIGLLGLFFFGALELISYLLTLQPTGTFIRIGIIFFAALLMLNQVRERESRERQLLLDMAEQKELQMKIMVSQLQPHFVFNVLGAIRLMIHVDSETAYDMLYDFSQFMRSSIHAIRADYMIPFSDEPAQIKAYMNIEKKRFNDCIKAEYDIGTTDFVLPALTIQPIVADIVMHEIRKKGGSGTVILRTYEKDGYVTVQLEDNIGRMDAGSLEAMRQENAQVDTEQPDFYMDFAHVKRRLERQTGAVINVWSGPGKGTCVRIVMPLALVSPAVRGGESK